MISTIILGLAILSTPPATAYDWDDPECQDEDSNGCIDMCQPQEESPPEPSEPQPEPEPTPGPSDPQQPETPQEPSEPQPTPEPAEDTCDRMCDTIMRAICSAGTPHPDPCPYGPHGDDDDGAKDGYCAGGEELYIYELPTGDSLELFACEGGETLELAYCPDGDDVPCDVVYWKADDNDLFIR